MERERATRWNAIPDHPRLDHDSGTYWPTNLRSASGRMPEYSGIPAVPGLPGGQFCMVGHYQFQQLACSNAYCHRGRRRVHSGQYWANGWRILHCSGRTFLLFPLYLALAYSLHLQHDPNPTLPQSPSKIIGAIGIFAGIFGGISGFIGPLAVFAGAGAVANGLLTEQALTLTK